MDTIDVIKEKLRTTQVLDPEDCTYLLDYMDVMVAYVVSEVMSEQICDHCVYGKEMEDRTTCDHYLEDCEAAAYSLFTEALKYYYLKLQEGGFEDEEVPSDV